MIRFLFLAVCLAAIVPTTANAQAFLVNKDGNLLGIPPAISPDPSIRDYGIDMIDGNAYWDFFGTGAFYLAEGELVSGKQPGSQVWHVDFGTKVRRPITTGNCIPGVDGIKSSYLCGHLDPIAVSRSGHFAYIQQITLMQNDGSWTVPEDISNSVVIASLASAEAVSPGKPESMSWSPDGNWLLMTAGTGLTMLNRTSGKICDFPNIVSNYQIQHVDWGARNGGEIVYEAGGNIWLLPLRPSPKNRCPRINTNKLVQLTNTDDSDKHPQWVGNFVAFASTRATSRDTRENIWAVNPDTLATAVFAAGDGIDFHRRFANWYGGSN